MTYPLQRFQQFFTFIYLFIYWSHLFIYLLVRFIYLFICHIVHTSTSPWSSFDHYSIATCYPLESPCLENSLNKMPINQQPKPLALVSWWQFVRVFYGGYSSFALWAHISNPNGELKKPPQTRSFIPTKQISYFCHVCFRYTMASVGQLTPEMVVNG